MCFSTKFFSPQLVTLCNALFSTTCYSSNLFLYKFFPPQYVTLLHCSPQCVTLLYCSPQCVTLFSTTCSSSNVFLHNVLQQQQCSRIELSNALLIQCHMILIKTCFSTSSSSNLFRNVYFENLGSILF